MRRLIYFVNIIVLLGAALLGYYCPDRLSMVFLGFMAAAVAVAEILGLIPTISLMNGLTRGQESIRRAAQVQTDSIWEAVKDSHDFFGQKKLDKIFSEYCVKVQYQRQSGQIMGDIEDALNEDVLDLLTWHGVVRLVPGTLTGLGILGTFTGLLIGIRDIGFGNVGEAMSSVESLLAGINTAFYTSIAGVILSVLFNFCYQIPRNMMLRELGVFTRKFHNYVIPTVKEQELYREDREASRVIQLLERLPDSKTAFLHSMKNGGSETAAGNEQVMMPQIVEGIRKGEFVYYLQPRYHLLSRQMTGAEALVRWIHPTIGVMSPGSFMPIIERNGYITQLDRTIWESVFRDMRKWYDEGLHPVPVTLNVTKTDIMAMDVHSFFKEMLEKYQIPPRGIDVDIAESIYLNSYKVTSDIEQKLMSLGLRVIVEDFSGDFLTLDAAGGVRASVMQIDMRRFGKGSEFRESEVRNIVTKAHSLNLRVFATGVESLEQLSALRKAGCDEGQGYYLGKPMPIDEFRKLATGTQKEE